MYDLWFTFVTIKIKIKIITCKTYFIYICKVITIKHKLCRPQNLVTFIICVTFIIWAFQLTLRTVNANS